MRPPRKGSMLLETLTALTAGSAVMLLAISVLHQAMVWHRNVDGRQKWQHAAARLAMQWRSDCREAISVQRHDNGSLTFRFPTNARIRYRFASGTVLREEFESDEDTSALIRRERWELGEKAQVTFEPMEANAGAVLTLQSLVPWDDAPKTELRIEAYSLRSNDAGRKP